MPQHDRATRYHRSRAPAPLHGTAGRFFRCALVACSTIAAPGSATLLAQAASPPGSNPVFEVPGWAFPLPAPAPPVVLDSVTQLRVPGSQARFTALQVRDRFAVPDWHPETHPPMPPVVAHGRKPGVIPCGFCHLPDGAGRPENAMLAGLPAAYIVQQVADMKSRARTPAWKGPFGPSDLMRTVADSATDTEIAEAAGYFSSLTPRQRARVVEATSVPRSAPGLGLYVPAPEGGAEPLGVRLIEMPADPSRHERRDPNVEYIAYVPPGSIARGAVLATTGTREGVPACIGCHGPELRGLAAVPPLAGRSPSYILRQLLAFKVGARAAPASAPMGIVTAAMGLGDMIAAAAYAGTLKP